MDINHYKKYLSVVDQKERDERWGRFVKVHLEHTDCSVDITSLIENLGGRKNLATIIFNSVGSLEVCNVWIKSSIPALDGLTPLECLEQGLENRLRETLMRFPD